MMSNENIKELQAYANLDKRMALLEQRLDTIQNNHLFHIEKDINNIKSYFLWGVGAVFVQLIAVISMLLK